MSSQLVTLLFDGALALLLIVTISYCSRVSKRIRMLQDSRGELASMIKQFDNATERAMSSLGELQTVSKKITDALQIKIEKANFLADDLAFLIEKSAKLATQLEQARKPHVEAPASKAAPPAIAFAPKPLFDKAPGPQLVKSAAQREQDNSAPKAVSSLEAVLQRLATSAASAAPSAKQAPSGVRTEAERELLEALKAGR